MLAFQDRLNFVHGVNKFEPLTPIIGEELKKKTKQTKKPSCTQMFYNHDNLHQHNFS